MLIQREKRLFLPLFSNKWFNPFDWSNDLSRHLSFFYIRIKFYLICLLSYNLCDTITEFFLLIFTFKLNKRKRILKNIIIVVYFLCKIIIYWKNVNFLIKFWIYFSLHFLAYFNRFFYEKEKSMERKVFWSIFVIAFILIFQKFELITIQRWRDILPLL